MAQIKAGRPVIVGVKISGGQLTASSGVAHWALAIGFNPVEQKIILNDPGTSSGSQKQYRVADFDKSWATQGRVYAPVYK